MPTPAERNLAAERRAVEEGHHALLNGPIDVATDRLQRNTPAAFVSVVSDITPGQRYHVGTTSIPGCGAVFTCTPNVKRAGQADHGPIDRSEPGIAPCKHAALAARRLEREGLLRFDYPTGLWLDSRQPEPAADTSAVFEGLNR